MKELLTEEQLEAVQGGNGPYDPGDQTLCWAKCLSPGCNWKWEGKKSERDMAELDHNAATGHGGFREGDGKLP